MYGSLMFLPPSCRVYSWKLITPAGRHRVEVSPPFFFVLFFFLIVVVLRVRYANAEPTFLKAQPRSQCHPRVKAPTDEQEWQELIFFACFCTYMCPRFVQYIHTSLLLKWRSINQGPHSNGALFWPVTDLAHLAWQRVHRHHRSWQTVHLSS